jgi:soluble lytic murein transglycosylase-like protein
LLFQIPRALILAMIEVESAGNVAATSPRGAVGLMQLMPATATRMGVSDARAARDNILGGTRYLRQLMNQFRGNLLFALAAYNAGPGAVRRYRGIPPYRETQHYVRAVLSRYQKHARQFS